MSLAESIGEAFRPSSDRDSSHVLASDQSGTALIGQVRPQPVNCHRRAVAEADQEIDMCRAPGQPGPGPSSTSEEQHGS